MELDAAVAVVDRRRLEVGERGSVGGGLVEFSIFDPLPPGLKQQLLQQPNAQRSRCIGCILGMAIGDAVGAPIEFMPVESEAAGFDPESWAYWGSPRNMFGFKPGQWTDDASMGLCLADSLICCGGLDGSDFVARLWNWNCQGYNNGFRHDTARMGDQATREFMIEAGLDPNAALQSLGCGKGTRRMLFELTEGEPPPPVCLSDKEYEGNGAVIRLAAVPVFSSHLSEAECMRMAGESAMATQNGPCTAELARLFAWLMRRAIVRAADNPSTVQEFIDQSVAEYLLMLAELPEEPAVALVRRLLQSGEPDASTERCWNWRNTRLEIERTLENRGESYNGHTPSADYFGAYSFDGFAAALWAVFHTDSGTAAVVKAANVLGDADSISCMAGQLSGAFYGAQGFDARLVQQLREWDPECEVELRAVMLEHVGMMRKD